MPNGLSGRAVIVTGAANGFGLATARRFAAAGASVMMADFDEDKLIRECQSIAGEGHDGTVLSFHGDLREKLSMTNLMAATIDAFEGLHVLVNAARILTSGDPLDAESDHFEETIQTNVTSGLRLSQIAAKRMIGFAEEEKPGPMDRAIINVSSVFAQRVLPELMAYSVASAATEQMTRCLAVALAGHRIRVNAVAPGGIVGRSLAKALSEIEDLADALDEVTPLGRTGEQSDVAEAAVFLASPASRFTTGQILAVDGGRLLLDPLEGAAI